MKKIITLLMPLLLLGALRLPLAAQDDENAAPKEAAAAPAKTADKTADKPVPKKKAKKAAAKKKAAKKKKPAAPVSEYKFSSAESAPTYKFDKKGNPIVKAKKKKPAKKASAGKGKKSDAGKKAAPAANAKLKPAKPIGAEEDAKQEQQPGDKQVMGQVDSSEVH